MTAHAPTPAPVEPPAPVGGVAPLLGPGWPLTALFGAFPLWWLLGVSHFAFIALAAPMAVELLRRRPLVVPHGFGLWLLFLVWTAGGLSVLWAYAPGTEPEAGLGRLIPFGYRGLWLLAITVVALYILNLSERELPTRRVLRLLGWMFVVTVVGGLAGLLVPRVSFPSALELVLPLGDTGFLYSLVHPSLSAESELLGYVQPRPTAPFAYANAWGNNLGLYLPFFLVAWLGRDGGWRRVAAPIVLAVALVPIALSLNRGLWLGLGVGAVVLAVRWGAAGRLWGVGVLGAAVTVACVVLVSTPLYDTLALRLETPHSNERRTSTAEQVVTTTWEGSPVLGYGSNRTVQGSYASIAGGETPDCHQCAAPPLGTQGFTWRLVFTAGFVGAGLCLGFLLVQLWRWRSSIEPVVLAGWVSITMSLVFFLVYDSLESSLFTLMMAVGLMNRQALGERDVAA